jgi:hypothetical protein
MSAVRGGSRHYEDQGVHIMRLKHAAVPAAALALSFGALVAPAEAKTQHCDSNTYPNKVEVDVGPTYDSDLPEGTAVCLKAGTKIYETTVGPDGLLVQDSIKNKPGNAYLGISYYAYGDVCVDDPYTYEDECDEGGGTVS